jgi:hypothetical protein
VKDEKAPDSAYKGLSWGYWKSKISIIEYILFTMTVLLLVYFYFLNNDIRQKREHCGFIAENEAGHIATTIDCVMTRTRTLVALVQDHGGSTDFFKSVAGAIYYDVRKETGVTLKNLALAPKGIVSDVYPYTGNESLIGFDFMDLSRPGNQEAVDAYEKGFTILTNPFTLVQGGMGMAGRAPVLLEQDRRQKLWGLVTVTIDFDNLLLLRNIQVYH